MTLAAPAREVSRFRPRPYAIVAKCHNFLARPQSGHYSPGSEPAFGRFRAPEGQSDGTLSYSLFKDLEHMRKIVIAAAIAGAALSLAACSNKTNEAASAASNASSDAAAAASEATSAADATAATSGAADATSTTTSAD